MTERRAAAGGTADRQSRQRGGKQAAPSKQPAAEAGKRRASAPKTKISVTVDEQLWREVRQLVAGRLPAANASAAVEQALGMWVANERLARALDEMYDADPRTRPTDDEVARASSVLDL